MTVPYRPSNGSEGLLFQHRWCNRCIHDKGAREERWEDACPIWSAALLYRTTEPEYPPELVRDADNVLAGRCTKFAQDPAEPFYSPDLPRVPLPSEIMGQVLGGKLHHE